MSTDTRQALAAQREQFEAWCIKRWRGDRNALLRNLPDADDHPDEYKMGPIEFAWQAYRAALAAQPVAGAVAEPDCWAILTPNGSKLVSPDEAKGRKDAYPLYTGPQPQAAPAPEPSAQAVAHPSHQTVREWMPVSEALRLSDLWTAGDLDNSGQWRAAIKVLADEVRALAASPQPEPSAQGEPVACDRDAPVCPWCDRQGLDICQHADDARTCGK